LNKFGCVIIRPEVSSVGVGSRVFRTFLCDACGREVIAEENTAVDGYFIEVLQVHKGEQIHTDNVYACSAGCVERAVRDGLKRETLPEDQKITATQELWLRGQKFTPSSGIPILDATDRTTVIGTAHEIENYRPPAQKPDPLSPDWKPEFKGKPQR